MAVPQRVYGRRRQDRPQRAEAEVSEGGAVGGSNIFGEKYSAISQPSAAVTPKASARSIVSRRLAVWRRVRISTPAVSIAQLTKCIQSSNESIVSNRLSRLPKVSVNQGRVTSASPSHGYGRRRQRNHHARCLSAYVSEIGIGNRDADQNHQPDLGGEIDYPRGLAQTWLINRTRVGHAQ